MCLKCELGKKKSENKAMAKAKRQSKSALRRKAVPAYLQCVDFSPVRQL